jgi:hypothetical protein
MFFGLPRTLRKSKGETQMNQRFGAILLFCMFFASMLVTSCSADGGKPNPPSAPTITNPPFRPLIALDIEIDTPPLYNLGHDAALAVANTIEKELVRQNTGGSLIFLCLISSRSFEQCPISFQIQPIPAFTMPPQLKPCGSDPFACSKQKGDYKKAIQAWLVIHASEVKTLARIAAWVHTQADKIRSLNFRNFYDDTGSDIYGALASASQNFQGVNAARYLVMATDFVSTTTQQGSFSLAAVHVTSIFRTCSDNAYCQQSNSHWSSVVRSAGASTFQVFSPAASSALGLGLTA